MPRVKLNADNDPLKEIILGKKGTLKMTHAELDKRAKFPDGTFKRLKEKHTDEWKLSQIKSVCYALNIPIERVRQDIKF